MEKRPALGKGLRALIPDALEPPPVAPRASMEVDIDRLIPNSWQPRSVIDDRQLEELAQSVRAHGVIQPLIVRRIGDRFQIIAGERRWRAAQHAGLLQVPVVVREIAPGEERSLLELALIENIQRADLNPIDEALAYRRLADEFQLSQEAIAAAVGKDRASIANYLRLLRLPDDVRAEVAAGRLSMGHARALVSLTSDEDLRRLAQQVVVRHLSVRETEALAKKIAGGRRTASTPTPPDVHTRAAEERLRLALGTRVRISRQGSRGTIEIDFTSEEELIRLFDQLTEGR